MPRSTPSPGRCRRGASSTRARPDFSLRTRRSSYALSTRQVPVYHTKSHKHVSKGPGICPPSQCLSPTPPTLARHPILPARPSETSYAMIGGLLFLPLSWEIYDAERSTRALRSFCEAVRRQYADEEVVVLSEVFPHPINEGYLPPRLTRLLEFNGEAVRNMSHLTRLAEEHQGEWMRFRFDSNLQQIITLDARENAVWNATREICRTYSVPHYKTRADPGEVAPWDRPMRSAAATVVEAPVEGSAAPPS